MADKKTHEGKDQAFVNWFIANYLNGKVSQPTPHSFFKAVKVERKGANA